MACEASEAIAPLASLAMPPMGGPAAVKLGAEQVVVVVVVIVVASCPSCYASVAIKGLGYYNNYKLLLQLQHPRCLNFFL